MRLHDPEIAHALHCYSQQGPIQLADAFMAQSFQQRVFLNEPDNADATLKGAYFMALIMTMSHELETGQSVPDVAWAFFDAKSIEEVSPEMAAGTYGLDIMSAQAVSERAKINAQMTTTQQLHTLLTIAYASFRSDRFEQGAYLNERFTKAIRDNNWGEDFVQIMSPVFSQDINKLPNGIVEDMRLQAARSYLESQKMALQQHGPYQALDADEYRLIS